MTRTERSISPRALLKDRSEARNGLDSHFRKGGAGAHNWGSLDEEARHEFDALRDEEEDFENATNDGDAASSAVPKDENAKRPSPPRTISEEDRLAALRVRQKAFKKGDVDLSDIARSSAAVSGSPPRDVSSFPIVG